MSNTNKLQRICLRRLPGIYYEDLTPLEKELYWELHMSGYLSLNKNNEVVPNSVY